MNRAASEVIFSKIVELINHFKKYFILHRQEIYENPSPGKKSSGISTWKKNRWGVPKKAVIQKSCLVGRGSNDWVNRLSPVPVEVFYELKEGL